MLKNQNLKKIVSKLLLIFIWKMKKMIKNTFMIVSIVKNFHVRSKLMIETIKNKSFVGQLKNITNNYKLIKIKILYITMLKKFGINTIDWEI